MKTKFNKSDINISGQLEIRTGNGIVWEIDLKGLNQSRSGVYCLRNKLNGRLYIGMARNLQNRFNRHMRDLEKTEHINPKISQDYIEAIDKMMCEDDTSVYFPSDVFEFEVIIYCYPSQLTFWEGILIDNLKPYYNIHKKKEIPDYTELLKHFDSDEIIHMDEEFDN
jgi:GIY-YIG catalytic domain-containing protein